MTNREPKGWGVKRKKPICTRTGLVIYKRGKGDWIVKFPDDYKHYGKTTAAELISFFAYLAEEKSLREARQKVGWE